MNPIRFCITLLALCSITNVAHAQACRNITVTNSSDSGAGTLRQALLDVCAPGTIRFLPSVREITLQSELLINTSLTMDGDTGVIVQRDANAAARFRIFRIPFNTIVQMKAMTIRGGSTTSAGGGINNNGTLTLLNSTVSRNRSDIHGGGIANEPSGTLIVRDSAIVDNIARQGAGVAQVTGGSITLSRCLIAGNNSALEGGGVFAESQGSVSNVGIDSCTLTNNSASAFGGAIVNRASTATGTALMTLINNTIANNPTGQGVANLKPFGGTVELRMRNNILHNNSPANLALQGGATVISQGNNISSDSTGAFGFNDRQNIDARLGPLANNGGPTLTFSLQPNSPAIDRAGASPALDQRSATRPQGPAPDIGSFEASCALPVLTPEILAIGDINQPYSQQLSALGVSPMVFVLSAGALPNGLTLADDGLLSGTANASGNFSFEVSVGDAQFCTRTQSFTLLINGSNPAPTYTPVSGLRSQQGSTPRFDVIANIADSATPANSLVLSAPTASLGLSIASLGNNAGQVTAAIAASCNATLGSGGRVGFSVSDGNMTTIGSTPVLVTANTPPAIRYDSVTVALGANADVAGIDPSDNGSITSYAIGAPSTYTGGATITPDGLVRLSNASPVGEYFIGILGVDNCGAMAETQLLVKVIADAVFGSGFE
jgi:hypothetical protein